MTVDRTPRRGEGRVVERFGDVDPGHLGANMRVKWCDGDGHAFSPVALTLQRVGDSIMEALERTDVVAHRMPGQAVVMAAVEGRRQAEMRRTRLLPELRLLGPLGFAARTHRRPHLDADGSGVAARLLSPLAQSGEYVERALVGGIGVGHPAIAPFGDALERPLVVAAEPDRDLARSRARVDAGILDAVPAALKGHMRVG